MYTSRFDRRVTIGLPVFNGEPEVGDAISALLAQTLTDFELVISDNASTDRTGEICQTYAERDPRIRYIRQERNIGAAANFRFLLQISNRPFFMWAACDDRWAPEFLQANVSVLERCEDVIASVSKGVFVDGERAWPLTGTGPLMSGVKENCVRYLRSPGDNSRFYSVFRRDVLERCVDDDHFLGDDWFIVLRTLCYGKYYEVQDCLLYRGAGGTSSDPERLMRTLGGAGLASLLFPLFQFTRRVLRDLDVPKTPDLLIQLARHNMMFCVIRIRLLLGRFGVGRFRNGQRALQRNRNDARSIPVA
jgi:glycosyltransferase involved in cell wall biosynthesis